MVPPQWRRGAGARSCSRRARCRSRSPPARSGRSSWTWQPPSSRGAGSCSTPSKARVDQGLREIELSARASDVERIYIPGEIEAECAERRRKEGIPIPDEVVNDFAQLGEELGVPFPARPG